MNKLSEAYLQTWTSLPLVQRWSLSQNAHPEIQEKKIDIGCRWAKEKSVVLRKAALENIAVGLWVDTSKTTIKARVYGILRRFGGSW